MTKGQKAKAKHEKARRKAKAKGKAKFQRTHDALCKVYMANMELMVVDALEKGE